MAKKVTTGHIHLGTHEWLLHDDGHREHAADCELCAAVRACKVAGCRGG